MNSRPLAVFVHGTAFGAPAEGFAGQRALGDVARVVLFERRGYGRRADPGGGELGWPVDVPDLVALIEPRGRAHVVAHSNGGAAALVLASRRPELVRSLVLIEPNAPQAAPDHEATAARMEAERELRRESSRLDTREFTLRWLASSGGSRAGAEAWLSRWGDAEWAAADVARRERWVADAPVDFGRLRALPAPRAVVLGGGPGPARDAMRAMAEAVARRTGAELCRFEGAGHAPHQEEPARFNALLRAIWGRAR